MLADMIQSDKKGIIVGPITDFLGMIVNFIYELVAANPTFPALGVSIILLTIFARTLMLPFAFKQQKSMAAMQKIAPEANKIKEKYAGATDPEAKLKMQQETQALYSKHKINPFAGCLPMLFTLPIFFALNNLLRQTYLYIHKIGDLYNSLSSALLSMPKADMFEAVAPIAFPKFPKGMEFSIYEIENLKRVLNKFNLKDWEALKNAVSGDIWATIQPLYEKKVAVESFLNINLVEFAGLSWPGILIPILTAATTLLSSLVMMKTSPSNDQAQKTQQYMMMIVMPIMMFVFTINMSSGVGIYWITSSVYQSVQQYFLNKYYSRNKNVVVE